jgi:two-component system chemotaxis sensor kinase CheA
MRISEEKVDGFMSYVGELIVTAETFNYLQKMIEQDKVNPNTVRAFKNANQAFRELSDELQESLMEIRRVPIKGILQKVNMMARELSHQLRKKVKVQLEGQEVQLDKSIAESLEAPLVHVVRNSLDHGLEPVEIRESAGKDPEGLLRVTASADKEYFYLTVEDDGKGIDPDLMRAVAVEKGYLSEVQAAALTEKEAIGLIFGAGFSTAKVITDVSGRGVGMDVVRTNINALNGSITVDSAVGKGTTITLKIPLSVTLQVIKALHVRVGQANFIISLDEILESLRPMREELSTVEGRGLVLNRRGQITPLIKLYEIFNLEPQFTDPVDGLVVMVETPSGRYALLVDAVMGQQQVVVKELGAQFKRLSFLSGSALLGDGGLGLVLDAGGVVNLAFGFGGEAAL